MGCTIAILFLVWCRSGLSSEGRLEKRAKLPSILFGLKLTKDTDEEISLNKTPITVKRILKTSDIANLNFDLTGLFTLGVFQKSKLVLTSPTIDLGIDLAALDYSILAKPKMKIPTFLSNYNATLRNVRVVLSAQIGNGVIKKELQTNANGQVKFLAYPETYRLAAVTPFDSPY